MSTHILSLLDGALADPDRRLSQLPLLSEAEWHGILDWNAAARVEVADSCPHELFEAQAAATPRAPALIFGGEQLTYDQTNRRANRLARRLRGLGVGPEVPVGICVERSVEMIIGLLAVLKAGGTHVPLDPAFPAERLAFMIGDAGFPVILTQERLVSRLPTGTAATIVRLDAGMDDDVTERDDNLGRIAAPDNLVYILYTSGSTGRPKGAGLCHKTLTSLIEWQNRITPMVPLARPCSSCRSASTSASSRFFHADHGHAGAHRRRGQAGCCGAARVLHEERIERAFFPYRFAAARRIGMAARPPSQRRHLTGEPLVVTEDIARFFRGFGGCRLHSDYDRLRRIGSVGTRCRRSIRRHGPLPPIGRCVDNAEIFILDAIYSRRRWVPAIFMPAAFVWRARITGVLRYRERFIPHPFSERPGRSIGPATALAFAPTAIEYLGRPTIR